MFLFSCFCADFFNTSFYFHFVQKRGQEMRIKICLANTDSSEISFYVLQILIPTRMIRLQVTNCISLLVNLEINSSFELFLIFQNVMYIYICINQGTIFQYVDGPNSKNRTDNQKRHASASLSESQVFLQ